MILQITHEQETPWNKQRSGKNLRPYLRHQIQTYSRVLNIYRTIKATSLKKAGLVVTPLAFFALFNLCTPPTVHAQGLTSRASVDSTGIEGIDRSHTPSISGDGRMVVFASQADNLVPNDTNGFTDIFAHDRLTGETQRVSVDSQGNEANEKSFNPTISQDGRVIAFRSVASNLDSNGPDTLYDLFIHDLDTGVTTGIHASSFAEFVSSTPTLNANGRFVAFISYESDSGITYPISHLFLHDRQTAQTTQVSLASGGGNADGSSSGPIINGNGQYLAFQSDATNLIQNESQGGIFIYDRTQAIITRAGIDSIGTPTNAVGNPAIPAMSADGQLIVFHTSQSGTFSLYDRVQDTSTNLSISGSNPTMSGDGRFIVFEDIDVDASTYVYLHDRSLNTTERIDINSSGELGNFWFEGTAFNPTLSSDGKFVAYESWSTNLVPSDTNFVSDIFVHERDGTVNSSQNLSVTLAGVGTGTITSNYSGIDCGTDCSQDFTSGLTIVLTATPDSGVLFSGWSGACSGIETCLVTMTQAQTVTATFDLIPTFPLTITSAGTGTGTITSSPTGISCPSDCTEPYTDGTIVTLFPSASLGSTFTGWTGAGCSGAGVCSVTMDQAQSVTATFIESRTLVIQTHGGNGFGTVTLTPPGLSGLDCGSGCVEEYPLSTVVSLTATPDTGSYFVEWTGDTGCASGQVTMTTDIGCLATFTTTAHPLTVNVAGSGTGTITSAPSGISCPGDCSENYGNGSSVILTPTPDPTSIFTGWSGTACTSSPGACTLSMSQAQNVTATFDITPSWLLSISKAGDGDGTVTSTPPGIDCGIDCTENYLQGTVVNLTPTPSPGSYFDGWAGDPGCSGQVSLTTNMTCQATFTLFNPSGTTTRLSLDSAGGEGNNSSYTFRAMSADGGRFVAFRSHASNLVANDTNSVADVFVHDRQSGITSRVNVTPSGEEANNSGSGGAISLDGRYVAFGSFASNLVPGDQNNLGDIFVVDRLDGSITRASVSSSGAEADGASYSPSLSGDGRYVTFHSSATNLVPGDTNGATDVFVHDISSGVTHRVSVDSSGVQADKSSDSPHISADGRFITFKSDADNLDSGPYSWVDGIFLHDRQTGSTTRVSIDSSGYQANGESYSPKISLDGRFIVFSSDATNLIPNDTNNSRDVFLHDLQTQQTTRVSLGPGGVQSDMDSVYPVVNADGRFVAFHSSATNLVPGDTNGFSDIFLHDRVTGLTSRLSLTSTGGEGDGASTWGNISPDGHFVEFHSLATNLVPGDTNAKTDVFIHERTGPISDPQPLTVTLNGGGTGTVTSSVTGIDCGTDCTEDFLLGTLVTLTPTPDSGMVFAGWSGGCTGMDPCSVVLTGPSTVSATFEPEPDSTLSVALVGPGSGSVTSAPIGIACPGDCSETYTNGTLVTLTALPDPTSSFAGWTGAGCTGTETCVVTLDQAHTVIATFDLIPVHTLTIVTTGPGTGSVWSNPAGIGCPTDCTENFIDGTSVTLFSFPATGSAFDGWTGGGCSGTGNCIVTMDQAHTVTATYSNPPPQNLTILKAGGGTGTVSSFPSGIDCGTDCTEDFPYGSPVLTGPVADAGSVFVGWGGGPNCEAEFVIMNQPEICTAFFVTGQTIRISEDGTGNRAAGDSAFANISGDGRYVVFSSVGDNLVPNDTNGMVDVFLRDQQTGTTTRVSVDSTGIEGDNNSFAPNISQDGRFIVFSSDATNLVLGDTNLATDVFVHDRTTGQTTRVSVDSTGAEGNASTGDLEGWITGISANGHFVVFSSTASNLVAEDTNGVPDIFLHDRQTGETTRVSVDSSGIESNGTSLSPTMSANGRYVAFTSDASNLVPNDLNLLRDIFVYDRATSTTTRVSVATSGLEGNGPSGAFSPPSVSANGQLLVFESQATNLVPSGTTSPVNIYLHDLTTQTTTLISQSSSGTEANGFDLKPSLSGDGRFIAYASTSTNMVPGATDDLGYIYLYDRTADSTTVVNVEPPTATGGGSGGGFMQPSGGIPLNANGQVMAFQSVSNNLIPAETLFGFDIFVHDQGSGVNPLQPLTVTLAGTGQGSVTSSPIGINCGVDCAEDLQSGTVISLSATPNSDSDFSGWSGPCSGTSVCTITMTQAQNVTATFTLGTQPLHTLSVTLAGTGTGSVSSDIPGITCPTDCAEDYLENATVTLTGTSTAGSVFSGWNGGGCSGTEPCVVTITAAQSIEATFTLLPPETLTITVSGDGSGLVTSTPAGITCGSDCSELYPNSAVITLATQPDPGSVFDSWTGDPDCLDGIVTLTQGITCNATFSLFGFTTRVSVNSNGDESNGGSGAPPSINGDGQLIVFESSADNLVLDDTNGFYDVFVRDRQIGTTTRLSIPNSGGEGNGHSRVPTISAEGNIAAFTSSATNLVSQDTNGFDDAFVFNLQTGGVSRVSIDSSGNEGNDSSTTLSLSADGRYVLLRSLASNLVENDTNGHWDLFVHDRQTGETTRVTLHTDGTEGNHDSWDGDISADGRFVTFDSRASNLVPNDTNGTRDIFMHDRESGETTRINVNEAGIEGNSVSSRPRMSADGRYVTYFSYASNLVIPDTNSANDTFVYDRQTGLTSRVSVDSLGNQSNGGSNLPDISADGRFVVFESTASDLVPDDTNFTQDIFVHDRQTGLTNRVNRHSNGDQANAFSNEASISANGEFITFRSFAENLVTGDTNNTTDIFVHQRTGVTSLPQTLTVQLSGTGSGFVTSNVAGIDCGTDCSESYLVGSLITLTATPNGGSTFTGWSGPCMGTGSCSVVMTQAHTVTATFDLLPPQTLTVTVTGTGSGNVTSSPLGISCPGDCTENYAHGTVVTLTSVANPDSVFTGWSGACTGTGTCQVTLSQAENVQATFTILPVLTVTTAGSGSGTVMSSPVGIACPSDCTESYADGTLVTLTATENAGSIFSGWSGAGCTGTGNCMLTMTQAESVTATFASLFALTVTSEGAGSGTVNSSPIGVSCPGDCAEDYPDGTVVNLSPAADTGSTFAGWSGACSGSGSCNVTMSQAQSVTATFDLLPVLTVTINGTGTGSVTSNPNGISCPSDCTEPYANETIITLTAAEDPNSIFTGWSGGACSGTGPCIVTLSQAETISATFTQLFALTITTQGPGTGTVSSTPTGISCPTDCSEDFTSGTAVTLTATASPGSVFSGWTGAGCSGTAPCLVTMSQAQNVTATFTPLFALTVSSSGTGTGTITSNPGGISCPGDCAESYISGTVVTLTPTPNLGSTFDGWSGSCSGLGDCTVTMSQVHTISATFNAGPDFRTQIVKMTIPPNSQSVTATAPGDFNPVDPVHTIALISGVTQHAMGWTDQRNQRPSDISAQVNVVDGSTLLAIRSSTKDQSDTIWILLVEYVGPAGGPNEFVIRDRRGYAWSSGQTATGYGPITSINDSTKTVVFASGVENPNSKSNQFDRGDVRAWVDGTNTVQLARGDGSGAIASVHQVVEFVGSNWTIQSGSTVPSRDPGGTDVTINTVNDVSTVWVYFTWSTNSANLDERGHRVWLNSPTNLRVQEDAKATGNKTIRWYVIQNPELTVQTGSAENQFTGSLTASISGFTPVGDVTKAFAWVTGLTDGGGNAHPRDMWQFELADDSTISLQRGYSGQELSYRYQVVEFP